MIRPIPHEIEKQLPAMGDRCRSRQQSSALRVAVTAGWTDAEEGNTRRRLNANSPEWDDDPLDIYRVKADTGEVEAKLAAAGFIPPRKEWSKPDPRGEEYGTYYAAELLGGRVHVEYNGADDASDWAATFESPSDFAAWAGECT